MRSGIKTFLGLFAVALLVALPAMASSVLQMDLDGLCERAGKAFRGTVTGISSGSISVGGGELPTVTYTLEVTDDLLGNLGEKTSITMVATKERFSDNGNIRRFNKLPELPALEVGGDYLLLTTPESTIGLSTTVGVGQGCFVISGQGKTEMATNLVGNTGLYDGPVPYSQLADDIRNALGQ